MKRHENRAKNHHAARWLLGLAYFGGFIFYAAAEEPTKDETIEFIAGYTHKPEMQSVEIEDCTLTKTIGRHSTVTYTWEVPVAKLDPTSIEINNDLQLITLYTRNGIAAVKFSRLVSKPEEYSRLGPRAEEFFRLESKLENKESRAYIPISTWRKKPYPEKLAKALTHLITLCGGKADPF